MVVGMGDMPIVGRIPFGGNLLLYSFLFRQGEIDMEERKIFDKRFVHFMWDDSLKGKEGFYADTIENLIKHVERNDSDYYGQLERESTPLPFRICNGAHWHFFYYDPMYEIKLAWKQGAQIQARVKDSKRDWVDLENPKWGFVGYKYRVKPEKQWRPFKAVQELKDTWLRKRYMTTAVDNPLEAPMIWVRYKSNKHLTVFISCYDTNCDMVLVFGTWLTMDQLFEDYEFLDGTPCGVEE